MPPIEIYPGLGFIILKTHSSRDYSYLIIRCSKLGVFLAGTKELTMGLLILSAVPLQKFQGVL